MGKDWCVCVCLCLEGCSCPLIVEVHLPPQLLTTFGQRTQSCNSPVFYIKPSNCLLLLPSLPLTFTATSSWFRSTPPQTVPAVLGQTARGKKESADKKEQVGEMESLSVFSRSTSTLYSVSCILFDKKKKKVVIVHTVKFYPVIYSLTRWERREVVWRGWGRKSGREDMKGRVESCTKQQRWWDVWGLNTKDSSTIK